MRPTRTLRALLLRYAAVYLLLIAFSSTLAAAGFYFWRQSSDQTVRAHALINEIQQVRGALYRQIKEVFDAVYLDDRDALTEYGAYATQIEQNFSRAQHLAQTRDERAAVERLQHAYRVVAKEAEQILAQRVEGDEATRRRRLNEQLEQGPLNDYERAFRDTEQFLAQERDRLISRLQTLARFAVVLLALPLLTAVGMLLASRRFMRNAFVEPLSAVMRATESISHGELEHRVPERGAQDFRQLAGAVNRMASDLAGSRAALLKAERQATLGALVPVVAHNIRNPLASIRATAQVIDEPGVSADVREGLRDIIRTADRLEGWTHSLLSYLHPLQPQRSLTRLSSVVDNALQLLSMRLQEKRLGVQKSGWEAEDAIAVDARLVEQALHGLLQNAIEASPSNATLRVAIRQGSGVAEIDIVDQGTGMAISPQATNLDPGPSTKQYGSGLGIPFAMKICEIHGGKLRFASATEGGTCVTMTLAHDNARGGIE